MTTEVNARTETHISRLLASGYTDVPEHGGLQVGQRVSHIGEMYSTALHEGTATLTHIFVRTDKDVEVVAKRDKLPDFDGFWADYHVVITHREDTHV